MRTEPAGAQDIVRIEGAERALETGRTEQARAGFAELTAAHHMSSIRGRAHLGLGRIALRSGDFETAVVRLGEARVLLRRDPRAATAELLHGEAAIRSKRYQSGINSLDRAFSYLSSAEDRTRAAYLIARTCELTGTPTPPIYADLARGARFPEYVGIFDDYVVDPDSIPRPVMPKPPVVATKPPPVAAPGTVAVVSRKAWGAQPTRSNVNPNSRWTKITVHHTADQGAMVPLGKDNTVGYLRRLQEYFQDTKKYADLPYHFLIASDGKTYEGRSMRFQGAHAGGAMNQQNIGVALIGNFEKHKPTLAQLNAMKSLIANLRAQHRIAPSRVYAHCDLKTTRCPGVMLEHELRALFGALHTDPDATHAFCGHEAAETPAVESRNAQ